MTWATYSTIPHFYLNLFCIHRHSRFQLNYYTSSFHQSNPVVLKINNRTNDDNVGMHSPALEKIIRTKCEMFDKTYDAALKQIHWYDLFLVFGFRWSDARLDWCGAEPFMWFWNHHRRRLVEFMIVKISHLVVNRAVLNSLTEYETKISWQERYLYLEFFDVHTARFGKEYKSLCLVSTSRQARRGGRTRSTFL